MRQQLDKLQTQAKTIEKFEQLFSKKNHKEFLNFFGKEDQEGTFAHYMYSESTSPAEKTSMAFDALAFDPSDERHTQLQQILAYVKKLTEKDKDLDVLKNPENTSYALHVFILVFKAIKNKKDDSTNNALIELTHQLVIQQKNHVQQKITDITAQTATKMQQKVKKRMTNNFKSKMKSKINAKARADAEAMSQIRESRIAVAKKVSYYTGIATLGVTAGGVLLKLNPQFALMLGANLPVIALASIAAMGLAAAAYKAYSVYRAYHSVTPVVESSSQTTAEHDASAEIAASTENNPISAANDAASLPGYSKATTIALATAGTTGAGLLGLSMLAYFSPQTVLLIGLQMPPMTLAVTAAAGTVLLGVALYLSCKKLSQSREVAEANDTTQTTEAPVEASTCFQRASQYAHGAKNYCVTIFARTAVSGEHPSPGQPIVDHASEFTATI